MGNSGRISGNYWSFRCSTRRFWLVSAALQLTKNQRLYGRGILDNKGPILACLYGMKLLKELGYQPKKTIRLMFGTDEESGSGDIPLYLEKENAPVLDLLQIVNIQ